MTHRILTVDDSATIRAILLQILAADGFEVFQAEDGAVASALAHALRPDLIITDLNMSRVGGMAFIDDIRSHHHMRNIPIVVLSTNGDDESIRAGMERGAAAWITKPFDAESLLATVHSLL